MATVRDIVKAAFRKTNIGATGEDLPAEYAAEGLDALNRMLSGWKLRGVDVTATTLTLASTFPLAAEYEEGTIYLLAERVSPDYERPRMFDADNWFRGIQAAYTTITPVTLPGAVLHPPSRQERDGTLGWYD